MTANAKLFEVYTSTNFISGVNDSRHPRGHSWRGGSTCLTDGQGLCDLAAKTSPRLNFKRNTFFLSLSLGFLGGRHLVFRASGCRGHCLQHYFWRAWLISHGFTTKIFVSMYYTIADNGVTVLLHFEAAIFDFWILVWSESFHTDSSGLLDPKNMGVAVEILLLACLEPEIHLGVNLPPLVC